MVHEPVEDMRGLAGVRGDDLGIERRVAIGAVGIELHARFRAVLGVVVGARLAMSAGAEELAVRRRSVTRNRPKLEKLIEDLRKDDILVVTRLDRLARSTSDLLRIAERLTEKNAGLQSLDEPWADTTSPSGRMVMTIFAGIAEFERTLIISRKTTAGWLPKRAAWHSADRRKCARISSNWPGNSSATESRSAPLPEPSTFTPQQFTASSRDSSLMPVFCSAQPHRPIRTWQWQATQACLVFR